jgi:G3E family GTPase
VALSQLLAKAKPQRLLIEPTGLGHPKQIIESLSASHWQSTLKLEATLCVIDARQYQDERVQQHESFIAQAQVADVLVFSKSELLTKSERASVIEFSQKLPKPKPQSVFIEQGNLPLSYLSYKRQHAPVIKRSLLHDNTRLNSSLNTPQQEVIEPPYHYHQQALDCFVGGWIFPAHWQFEHTQLLDLLLSLKVQRVKGVIHTNQGWLSINLTALDANFNSCPPSLDSRLEIISQEDVAWQVLESALISLCVAQRE